MQEHPNYKYRPRRRKHNKRGGGTSPPGMGSPSSSTSGGRRPSSTPGPYPGSPSNKYQYNYSVPQNNFIHQVASPMQSPYYYNKSPSTFGSPYSSTPILHTPEASPPSTPELKNDTVQQPQSSLDSTHSEDQSKDGKVDGLEKNSTLPTPEMSPMEQEKDSLEKKKTYGYDLLSQDYRFGRFQQGSYGTASLSGVGHHNSGVTQTPIAAMSLTNGVVMMCSNQRTYEHTGIVTGTYFPPVATAQESHVLSANTSTHMYPPTTTSVSQSSTLYINEQPYSNASHYQNILRQDHYSGAIILFHFLNFLLPCRWSLRLTYPHHSDNTFATFGNLNWETRSDFLNCLTFDRAISWGLLVQHVPDDPGHPRGTCAILFI
ncbi:hypothetical protein RUM44_002091 [Polyplax serrata]|uniref:Uncharacterized protein n=1 Tax=Polyplax serrata TaxID=468196 RepID=A0ABR1ANF3_POLSC